MLYRLSYSRMWRFAAVGVRFHGTDHTGFGLSTPWAHWWAGTDSNHRTPKRTDLQSVAFNHSATCPCWSHPSELNRQPSDYKSGALPVELGWPGLLPFRWQLRTEGLNLVQVVRLHHTLGAVKPHKDRNKGKSIIHFRGMHPSHKALVQYLYAYNAFWCSSDGDRQLSSG